MLLKSIVQREFKFLLFVFLTIFSLNGCKSDAQVNFYDKSLKNNKLNCLSFTPQNNTKLEQKLKSLYKFDPNCPNRLELSYKSNIVCNSSYNAPQKATSTFPNAYLKLEVKKGFNLEYSYYIDLTSKPTTSDIEDAFNRLKKDILK
jgi:hypothetical protein